MRLTGLSRKCRRGGVHAGPLSFWSLFLVTLLFSGAAVSRVNAGPPFPDAVDDSATLAEDSSGNVIDVLANDLSLKKTTLKITAVTQGMNGAVGIPASADGVLYTPGPNFFGSDSFTYTVTDGRFSDTASVQVTVTSVNDPPVARDDVALATKGTSVNIAVLGNDSSEHDPGETLTIVEVGRPQSEDDDYNHPVVEISQDARSVVYTPGEYSVGDLFSYTIADGSGGTATARVKVAINESAAGPGSISGTVKDEDGNPVFGFLVEAQADSCCGSRRVFSDAGGGYSITGLGEGSYRVGFFPEQDSEFVRQYYPRANDWSAATLVSVGSDPIPTIDAVLVRGGVIAGRVTDEAGDPLPRVSVYASGLNDFKSATTDAAGGYAIRGLRADDYRVSFQPAQDMNYVREYYNDTVRYDALTKVTVSLRQTIEGIDAALAIGGAVEGRVTDSNGLPIKGITVSVRSPDYAADGVTDAEGNYRVEGLPTGSFTICFSTWPVGEDPQPAVGNYVDECYDDEISYETADRVRVESGETTRGINAFLAAGGIITGVVTDEEGNPASDVYVTARPSDPALGWGGGAVTDSEGRFSIDKLATGSYRVKFEPWWSTTKPYLPEWYDNQTEETAADLVLVTAGEVTTEINASLSLRPELRGEPDYYSTLEDEALDVSPPNGVLANDQGASPLSLELRTSPVNGYISLSADGGFYYQPKYNFFGTDTFTYVIRERHPYGPDRISAPIPVTIEVQSVNDGPTASPDWGYTTEDSPLTIDVLVNDSDPEADTLIVSVLEGPSHGAASVDGDGRLIYEPTANYWGSDSLVYQITDAGGATSNAEVSIYVNPVNDPPEAADDSITTTIGSPVAFNVIENDSDADGGGLWMTPLSQPSNGSVSCTVLGECTYTPSWLFIGADSFTYQLWDGLGGFDSATVHIDVRLTSFTIPEI